MAVAFNSVFIWRSHLSCTKRRFVHLPSGFPSFVIVMSYAAGQLSRLCEHLLPREDAGSAAVGRHCRGSALLWVGAAVGHPEPLLSSFCCLFSWCQRSSVGDAVKNKPLWFLRMLQGEDTLLRWMCTCLCLGCIILWLHFYLSSAVTSVCSRESSAPFPRHLSHTECQNRYVFPFESASEGDNNN